MKAAIKLRKEVKNRDGSHPLAVAVSLPNRKRVVRGLGLSAKPGQLDGSNHFKPQVSGAEDKNFIINLALTKANEILIAARLQGRYLTPDIFAAEWDRPGGSTDFLIWWEAELTRRKFLETQAKATLDIDTVSLHKFRRFSPKGLLMADVNPEYLERFDAWHKRILNNNPRARKGGAAARRKALKSFRKYLYEAIDKKVFSGENPFKRVSVGQTKRSIVFLSAEELRALYQIYLDGRDRDVLRPFLFACWTGLRISDAMQLNPGHIQENQVVLNMVKGEDPVRIPMNRHALDLLQDGGLPLFSISSGYLNRRLKDLAKEAGINKSLSFLVARHTFATLFLEHGSVEVLQKLMGHRKITTTMIYVHVTERRKRDQIIAMESLLELPSSSTSQ